MPCPCPCHHARRPRGDSVPSVIVLFRVDRCRIPVEISHLQNVRYASYGASPPLALQQRLPPAASIPKSPDKSRIRKSDVHRWHGAQRFAIRLTSHAARLMLVTCLSRGRRCSSLLLNMVASLVRLLTAPSGVVTIDRHIDHADKLNVTRRSPVLAVTLEDVTSATK